MCCKGDQPPEEDNELSEIDMDSNDGIGLEDFDLDSTGDSFNGRNV